AASTWSTRRLAALQQEHRSLQARSGRFEVRDPNRVWVAAVPHDLNNEHRRVWRWLVYLPANYNFHRVYVSGIISADSPRRVNHGSGKSWSSPSPEPKYCAITATLHRRDENDNWELDLVHDNGSGRLNFALTNVDDLMVETLGDNGPVGIDIDQPFCLLRMREPVASAPSKHPQVGNEPVYRGVYYYCVPQARITAFEKSQEFPPPPSGN
ncbi:MAG: hypothetical protein KDB14_17805, partial [Planctomycetales bacterium]|nr:hypothetical protein [Planctomycetales bacterium]